MPTLPPGAARAGALASTDQVAPVLAPRSGRRRRPSGEPPPLPRFIEPSTRWYVVLIALTAAFWMAFAFRPVARGVTFLDTAVLHAFTAPRAAWLTSVMDRLAWLGSGVPTRALAWLTIAVLILARRLQKLAVYLLLLSGIFLVGTEVSVALGRFRPTGVAILGSWHGYSLPSLPLLGLALACSGVVYTLVPAGRWRRRAKAVAAAMLLGLCVARLYLAVDHPTDVVTALIVGWALPVVGYRLASPEEAFPVSYRTGKPAHLDVRGRRGDAIVLALQQQLGIAVTAIEPFGLHGSSGSTPLRLSVRRPDGGTSILFGKLYAVTHLRSDRWYKLSRTVLYGRLEDEKPFSSVRRLVEYEDHMLRLLRDVGLPTPRPHGFVEITPEREYVIVMDFFEDAREIAGRGEEVELNDSQIDDGLRIVRRLWSAGVAHRDLKPSNLLVQGERILLIDVAFATVRPTPWRQAVDLANMMLTLGLASTAERVYARALRLFAPEDIAEAFAATRSITIPTQLRIRLRRDGRDLVTAFRRLAPHRDPVPIQLWSLRRIGVTVLVLAGVALTVALIAAYIQLVGLL